MLYYIGSLIINSFGPARLLQSYTVLIGLSLFVGFSLCYFILPKCFKFLPSDRGREFTLTAEAAKGKPTGGGIVFISIFVVTVLLFVPVDLLQLSILVLTWLTMLTGFLDDRSITSWGEYLKGALDLVICVAASFVLYYLNQRVIDGQ